MLNILVAGAGGRMGRAVISAICETDGVNLAGALEDIKSPFIGEDAGDIAGIGRTGIEISSSIDALLGHIDSIIDFTYPDSTIHNLEKAAGNNVSMIIGTTGFSHGQREILKKYSEEMRMVVAPNMSIGVNLLIRITSDVAKVLGGSYDVEIIEAHHRLKKDAPSGTAIRIAESVAHSLGRNIGDVAVYERHGIIGERSREEIGIQSIRAGDIVGDHTVLFAGDGERIEITHRAHSRGTFARGALRAAVWLTDKPEGIYDMQDVLGLKEQD